MKYNEKMHEEIKLVLEKFAPAFTELFKEKYYFIEAISITKR